MGARFKGGFLMRFDEAVKGLSPDEVAALQTLEAKGWQLGLDVRVEDMTKPDGERKRTFSNRGRYSVAAFLKNLIGRDRVEFPAFTPAVLEGIAPPVFPEIEKPVEVAEVDSHSKGRPVPWVDIPVEDVKREKVIKRDKKR